MNDAIYMITKHDCTAALYGKSAGQYHTMMDVLDSLYKSAHTLDELNHTAQGLVYDYCMPIETVVFDKPYTQDVFKVFTPCDSQNKPAAPVTITFDFDRSILHFTTTEQTSETFPTLTVRMYPALKRYIDTVNRVFGDDKCEDKINQELIHELTKLAEQRTACRERLALYELRTPQGTASFVSSYGGGLIAPITVASRLQKGCSLLSSVNISPNVTQLMEGVLLDNSLSDIPPDYIGTPMFEPLDKMLADGLRYRLDRWEEIAQIVTVNFYEETIQIKRAEWLSSYSGAEYALTFQQANEYWTEICQADSAIGDAELFDRIEQLGENYPSISLKF